jgi:hypothetical protein
LNKVFEWLGFSAGVLCRVEAGVTARLMEAKAIPVWLLLEVEGFDVFGKLLA